MTTIVYDPVSNIIAYDSQVTFGNVIFRRNKNKCKVINKHTVFAAGNHEEVHKYLKDLPKVHNVNPTSDIGSAFVVTPDKKVLFIYWDIEGTAYTEELQEVWAIGSGCEFALGALHVGCTAKRAVEIAIELDIYSGGKVKVYKIE